MRIPRPFYRKQNRTWYVQIGKKQHNLGKDKEAATQKYHALMLRRQGMTDETPVYHVLLLFLDWNKKHNAASTHEFYKRHVLSFATYVKDDLGDEGLRVEDLKPFHLTGWLDKSYANAGNNYRRSAIRSVQRAFNWAVKEGYLEKSPVAHVQKPPYIPRDVLITSEQWQSLVRALEARGDRGGALLELLTLLRETGCRPLEARTAEARHLDRIGRCLVFERSESKGHGGSHTVERRVVPLTDAMFAVCECRAEEYPQGPLFRNSRGTPWKRHAIKQWFKRLDQRRYKRPSIKRIGFRLSAYSIRHTWATEALERGVDPITVATIMGHKDLTMLMKVYQHLQKKDQHIRAAMHQAIGLPVVQLPTPTASLPT